MFSQSFCHVCNMMKKDVFTDESVAEYLNTHFTSLELDIEDDDTLGYKTFGTPTFYFLDASTKEILEIKIGGSTVKGMLKKLHTIVKDVKEKEI
jgi:thioredoxin-related protein